MIQSNQILHFFLKVAVLTTGFIITACGLAQAQTWTAGAGTSDWATAGNWSPATVPGVGNNVTIPNIGSGIYPVVNSNRQIANLTLSNWSAGGTLTVNNGATLTVTGNLTFTPNGLLNINGGATVNHTGTSMSFAWSSNTVININDGSLSTNAANPQVVSNISVTNGSLDFNDRLRISNNSTIGGASASISISGNTTINGGTSLIADNIDITGNVNLNGTLTCGDAEIVGAVTIAGGTLDCDSLDLTTTGNFNTSGGATITVDQIDMDITGSISMSSPSSLTAANGTISVGNDFTTNSLSAFVNLDAVDVTVADNLTIGANFTMTNGGTVDVAGQISITNPHNFNLGTATLNVTEASTIGGRLNVEDGIVNFLDDVTLGNSGQINVETGSVNVGAPGPPPISANFTLNGSAILNLNEGTFRIYGTSTFEGSGQFNAGSGTIEFDGDITFQGGSDFNADSSTVVMTGNVNIETNNNNNGGAVEFYNLVIDENATVTADADIFVYNDMEVEDGGDYENVNETSLNVVGLVIGDPQISADRPYLISIEILSATSIQLNFNIDLLSGTGANGASNLSNYNIETETETMVSATQIDTNKVVLVFSGFSIVDFVEYYLIVNNLRSAVNNIPEGQINTNHRKRFGVVAPPTFYSRANGNWNVSSSWSTVDHTGSSASRTPGQSGDVVIIGNSNTITINSTVTIAPIASVTVNSTGTLIVNSSGTLVSANKSVTGDGTFTLQSGGTLSIGSADGISSSGATGNIRTATRTFSTGANYVYNGDAAQITGSGLPSTVAELDIDNPDHVTATNSIIVSDLLDLSDGELILPSDIELVANTKTYGSGTIRARRVISGSTGWRLVASPLRGTYGDLFDDIVTQGYTGSTFPSRQPTVMWYDETYPGTDLQRWRAVSNATDSLTGGLGLYTFVFGNIDDDDDYNDDLPVTIDVVGREFEGDGTHFSWPVTYTAEADTGWNLIGNPFAATLNWDASGWTKTDIDNVIYVWDASANSGFGGYKEWNGTSGSMGNGLIKPFQAFWVKATSETVELEAPLTAKTTGGTFYKHVDYGGPQIEIIVDAAGMSASHHIHFSEAGSRFKDPLDAYRLMPLNNTNLDVFSVSDEGDRLAINHLPLRFSRPVMIPISVEGHRSGDWMSEQLSLRIEVSEHVQDLWDVRLVDRLTGEKLAAEHGLEAYTFTLINRMRKSVPLSPMEPGAMKPILGKARIEDARFYLELTPLEIDENIPMEFGLGQNYPNPFNPSTTIPLEVPIESNIHVAVYDLLGRQVSVLAQGRYQAGYYELRFDGSDLASGVYIYRLVTAEGAVTRKFTLLK